MLLPKRKKDCLDWTWVTGWDWNVCCSWHTSEGALDWSSADLGRAPFCHPLSVNPDKPPHLSEPQFSPCLRYGFTAQLRGVNEIQVIVTPYAALLITCPVNGSFRATIQSCFNLSMSEEYVTGINRSLLSCLPACSSHPNPLHCD